MHASKHDGSGGFGVLLRVYWMGLGIPMLWLALLRILYIRPSLPSVHDVIYWALVASIVAVRYVDIKYCMGRTSDADTPATIEHWRRYAMIIVGASIVGWTSVRLLGRLLG